MAVKYECPKCGRRFAEWGAEKMGFHCPKDEWCPKDASKDIQFVRAGTTETGGKAPSLKRRPRKLAAVAAPAEPVEEDVIVPDIDEAEDQDEEIDEEIEVEDEIVVTAKEPPEGEEAIEPAVSDDEDVEEGEVEDLDFEDGDADLDEDAEPEASSEEEWS